MAKLLKGFTDLLQPINLLPDVLAGGGGYPLSGTFTASSGDATYISKDIYIRTYNSNTTLTYTFSNRTLRIQGTVTLSSNIAVGFMYFTSSGQNNLILNELNTGIVTWTNNSSPEVSCNFSNAGGARVTYYNHETDNKVVNVGRQTGSSSVFGFSIAAPLNKTVTVDITINNVAVYEGAYTNPPFCKSIAQLSNEGLTGLQTTNRSYYNFSSKDIDVGGGSIGYRTFFSLTGYNSNRDLIYIKPNRTSGNDYYGSFYIEGYILKSFSNYNSNEVIKFSGFIWSDGNNTAWSHNITAIGRASGKNATVAPIITKLKVCKNITDDTIDVCFYYNSTTNNHITVIIKDFVSSSDYIMNRYDVEPVYRYGLERFTYNSISTKNTTTIGSEVAVSWS